ncbi:MAG: glycoside hydrolase family 97 N-terminal domain-containing protein, partial [Chlorobiales bacterium]|nr:glycoside hydrolase family 97 N-terminal domain-containing protein [Chlorobiales bacterium]
MKKLILICILLAFFIGTAAYAQDQHLYSPDRKLKFVVHTVDILAVSVYYQKQMLINKSPISLTIEGKELGVSPILINSETHSVDETIDAAVPVKSAVIRDYYNEARFDFKKGYTLICRAYNDGVTYRFETRLKNKVIVNSETMDLNFAGDYKVFYPEESDFVSHYERYYTDTSLSGLKTNALASLPVLLQSTGGTHILITEADLYDYPAMFLRAEEGHSLSADFPKYVLETRPKNGRSDRDQVLTEARYIAKTTGVRSFPWRMLIITDDDRKLVESQLVYQLSRPIAIDDPEWIVPGKVAWDWWNANNIRGVDFEAGINNDTYKYYIDFAAEYDLEYVILDEGWSESTTSIMSCNSEINVQELVAYGKEKNVGVILWVLWEPLEKDMEAVLDLYAEWGVKGVKVDFMQRADQS